MARLDLGCLPHGNPCAQCGKPIDSPEWIESGPGRTSYLWHCWACDYQFEAVAFFDDQDEHSEPLAACRNWFETINLLFLPSASRRVSDGACLKTFAPIALRGCCSPPM